VERPLAVYGKPVTPLAKSYAIRIEPVGVSRKGALYILKLDVTGMTAEKAREALRRLSEQLGRLGAHVLYAEASESQIYLQVRGSPFAWAAVLAWLPVILAGLGLGFVAIAVWQVVAPVPTWVWALLATGVFLLIFGPQIGEWIAEEARKAAGRAV